MRFDEWLWFPELPTEIFSMGFIKQRRMEPAAAQLQMSLWDIWTGNLQMWVIQLAWSIFLGLKTSISFSFDDEAEANHPTSMGLSKISLQAISICSLWNINLHSLYNKGTYSM